MHRVIIILAGTAALAAAAVGAGAGSARAATDKCARNGSRTLAQTKQVRVFRQDGRTFACHRERGRRWPLGDVTAFGGGSDFTIDRVKIRGRFVAYQLAFFDKNRVDYAVRVLSATSGRLLVDDDPIAAEPELEPRAGEGTGIQGLVLKDNGSVAWIAGDPGSPEPRYEVGRHDTYGRKLLDTGADVAPGSLRLSDGRVIRWVHGGAPRRARLR